MNKLLLVGSIAGIVVVALMMVGVVFAKRRPRALNVAWFQERWSDMQKSLRKKENWPKAIVQADKLLEEALKKKRFKGKSMGERLTRAQHVLTDNESVWFGHKLRSKIEAEPQLKLKESEVKEALLGIRQALKDLGALPDGK
ncbi:MAG TPA: hypothetical protein VIR03_00900 [Candidatus Saccharimonadales bacterium]